MCISSSVKSALGESVLHGATLPSFTYPLLKYTHENKSKNKYLFSQLWLCWIYYSIFMIYTNIVTQWISGTERFSHVLHGRERDSIWWASIWFLIWVFLPSFPHIWQTETLFITSIVVFSPKASIDFVFSFNLSISQDNSFFGSSKGFVKISPVLSFTGLDWLWRVIFSGHV